jgi:hypothetical protein
LLIALQHRAAVGLFRPFIIFVLDVVYAVRICFPDIDLDGGDWGAGSVAHGAEDKEGLAFGVGGDGGAEGCRGGVVRVVRAEDGAFG